MTDRSTTPAWVPAALFRLAGPILFLAAPVAGPANETPAAAPEPAHSPEIAGPLIACWSFSQPAGTQCLDASENAYHAAPEGPWPAGLQRVSGPFGGALSFSGRHKLRVPQMPALEQIERISVSAWIRPTATERYSEIFRKEDGDHRVLFSLQEHATVLALGLHVGGYVECDAAIDPAQVLDGRWHHAAATFDGRCMRVYLDGNQIGRLERPGRIAAGGPAPGCLGSSNGGECFQGTLDELRIYRDALTADQIRQLYRRGSETLAHYAQQLDHALAAFYRPRDTFAQTLAACRKKLAEQAPTLDPELAAALLARLKTDFPDDYDNFTRSTGRSALDYLTAEGSDFQRTAASRLVALLLEYKPLTPSQWERQTPEQRRRWEEAERIQARFERLQAQGAEARFSPEWVQIILDAGPRIDFRPRVAEAVAPYVPPQTPKTQDLSTEEARQRLQQDWLHQADGNPTPARIQKEITWTRQLAARIQAQYPGQVDFADQLARLDQWQKQAAALQAPCQALYFQVRQLKRSVMFSNPAVDFNKVLFVDMPFPQGSEWAHQTRHRLGYMAVPGGRLLVLDGLSPGGRFTQLMPQPPLHGSFWRPDLSYDAKTVVFCFKPHNEKSFHLYEIGVDGTGLVQLTDGPFDDLDPIYLPDGQHLLFSTTRGHTYVRCMPPTNAFVLARCDRRGKNIYLVSYNNEPDYLPSVMNDGRVIYTRWEYTDKPLWRAQALWTMNPDGTGVAAFWGNQSVWPDLLKDARSIPGSRRVMFTGSAHHNWFSGSVGIIDPDRGFNFPRGLTKVTADVVWPESGNGPVDPVQSPDYHPSGHYTAYYSPYPLSEKDFLVSANRGGKFVLYLMDVDGNRELIYEGVHHILHALPVRRRPLPPRMEDRVAWPDQENRLAPAPGTLFSSNVYYGAPEELRGKARYLRVLNIEPKTYTYWYKRPYISTGPVISAVQSEGVKRILGTVPIEKDGSVAFHVPASTALHFQLLDENFRALQTMRSFTGVLPGERRGCLGCHELHSTSPAYQTTAIALAKPPQEITPPPWGDASVSFPRFVQPVLDQYCGRCHQGDGEARSAVDLTDRPGFLIFSEPYLLFTGRPSWGRAYQKPPGPPPGFGVADMIMVEGYDQRDPEAYKTPKPMTRLSYKSRLIEIASSGQHYDVKVDPTSLRKLIAWVDTMCPYRGAEEIRQLPDPEFQGVSWLAIRPRIRTAPTVVRPGPVGQPGPAPKAP